MQLIITHTADEKPEFQATKKERNATTQPSYFHISLFNIVFNINIHIRYWRFAAETSGPEVHSIYACQYMIAFSDGLHQVVNTFV